MGIQDGSTGPCIFESESGGGGGAIPQRSEKSAPPGGDWPRQVGPFAIERLIGCGGMGTVFLAHHIETGARAAVKLAKRTDTVGCDGIDAEVGALATLEGANVVRLLDRGEDGAWKWMATEYVSGADFASYADKLLRPTPRPGRKERMARIRRVISSFRDLAHALTKLDDALLIHRDIKPRNILIGDDGEPYLIDFGLAVDAMEAPKGQLAGTPPYMSPEQASGWIPLSGRSDVYSLGVTVYEALTGRRVVEGQHFQAIRQVMFREVPPVSRGGSGIPRSLDPVFARALAKDPDSRYPTAAALVEDLDRWLAGRLPRHAPVGLTSRVVHAAVRFPTVTVALAITVLVVMWLFISSTRERNQILAAIDAELDRGDFLAAFDLAARHEHELGDDDAFVERERRAVLGGAPLRTMDLLTSHGLTGGGTGSPMAEHYAADARRLLPRTRHPDLLFHLVFKELLDAESPARHAGALLDAYPELVESSALLLEAALLIAETQGLADRAKHIRGLLALARPAHPDVSLCFRAYRMLWRRSDGTSIGGDDAIEALLLDLQRAIARQRPEGGYGAAGLREHRLLLTFEALALDQFGRYDAAHAALEKLVRNPSSDDERRAILVVLAAVQVNRSGPIEERIAEAVDCTLRAGAAGPRRSAPSDVAHRLALALTARRCEWQPAAEWLLALHGALGESGLWLDPGITNLLGNIGPMAMGSSDAQLVLRVLDATAPEHARLLAGGNQAFRRFLSGVAWSAYFLGKAAAKRKDRSELLGLAERVRTLARSLGLEDGADVLAVWADAMLLPDGAVGERARVLERLRSLKEELQRTGRIEEFGGPVDDALMPVGGG